MKPEAGVIENLRWVAPPEVQHALEFEVNLLTAIPMAGHVSDLELAYQQYSLVNERNYQVEQLVNKRFKDRFPDEWLFFQADCPDHGACRFWMRVAGRQQDLHKTPPARVEHNMNFLKPHEEWVIPAIAARPAPTKSTTDSMLKSAALLKNAAKRKP